MCAADGSKRGGGWVEAEQRALSSGTGVRGGQLLEQGGMRAADGANWGGGWVEAEQRMEQVGTSDGSERSNAPLVRGREHLYSAR